LQDKLEHRPGYQRVSEAQRSIYDHNRGKPGWTTSAGKEQCTSRIKKGEGGGEEVQVRRGYNTARI